MGGVGGVKGLDLFDSVGIDLRPQIREIRDERLKENLIHDGVYKMSLQEYAEHQVLKRHVGSKRYRELSEEEIREVGSCIQIPKERWGYYTLAHDAPLKEHRELIEGRIADVIELYEETDGVYGQRGKYNWRRKRDQAIRLGLLEEEA